MAERADNSAEQAKQPGARRKLPAGVFSPVMLDVHISRATARVMAAVFVVLLMIPGVWQLVHDARAGNAWAMWDNFRAAGQTESGKGWFPTHQGLKEFEDGVARGSVADKVLRGWYQSLLTRGLGSGNESIVVGEEGYLFYRQEVDMAGGIGFLSENYFARKRSAHIFDASEDVLTHAFRGIFVGGGGKAMMSKRDLAVDPVEAIADFRDQLAERGIRLLLVPVPVKPMIYPEKVAAGYPVAAGPAWNVDREKWVGRLRERGVEMLDLTDAFWAAKGGEALYLKGDTHWTPRGLGIAADAIAAEVRRRVSGLPELGEVKVVKEKVSAHGDLFDALFEKGTAGWPEESVEVGRVFDKDGKHLDTTNEKAEVLLLGDSYSNIYGSDSLSWGDDAGLVQQLMERLGTPVQAIRQDGGGAVEVRKMLAGDRGALANKKIVVWEFTTRDLFDEKLLWEKVKLPAAVASQKTEKQATVTTTATAMLEIEGKISAVAPKPVAKDNYPASMWTVRVEVSKVVAGKLVEKSMYVLFKGMENNELTAVTGLRVGQNVRVKLRKENRAEASMRRSYLEEMDLDVPMMVGDSYEVMP